MSAAKLDFRVGADKSALTHRETAKEARSTSSCSFAPWGEGGRRSDEGSYQCKSGLVQPPPRICKLITFANKFLSSPSEKTSDSAVSRVLRSWSAGLVCTKNRDLIIPYAVSHCELLYNLLSAQQQVHSTQQ